MGAREPTTRREPTMHHDYVLTLACPDRPGLVAAVTGRLFQLGGNIREAQQFDAVDSGRFFMRIGFDCPGHDATSIASAFADVADRLAMDLKVRSTAQRRKVLLLVSKFDHCLTDLIYRHRIGELPMDLVGIVSNHPREVLNGAFGDDIPFHHLPVTRETKPQQEAQIRALVEESGAELVVLARYMQILSDEMSAFLSGRCINIHHSFLPGFKGAKPYHQAFERGVKLVGATAHYVTGDLDEGPIIEQEVIRIDHNYDARALSTVGQDAEALALSRAVRWHSEQRVLINGHSTVVFR